MLERLVPWGVTVSETRGDRLDIELFPCERLSLGRAVEKRRREFITGRACAREALAHLGEPVVAIPSGPHGEPLWPGGIVGSITHCQGYRACVAARGGAVIALGIDAEPNVRLPDGVAEVVLHGRERELRDTRSLHPSDGEPVDLPRLVFSAKEAVYKAWFPMTGQWLGFEDVEISIDQAGDGFRARLLVSGPIVGGSRLTAFRGRWTVEGDIICTAVAIQ
jgi:4'-phosphopantetheinyl transferase EntD